MCFFLVRIFWLRIVRFWSLKWYLLMLVTVVINIFQIGIVCRKSIGLTIIVSNLWGCSDRFILIHCIFLLFCEDSRAPIMETLWWSILEWLILFGYRSILLVLFKTFGWCGHDVGCIIGFWWKIVRVCFIHIFTNYILGTSSLRRTIQKTW